MDQGLGPGTRLFLDWGNGPNLIWPLLLSVMFHCLLLINMVPINTVPVNTVPVNTVL